MKIKNPTLKFWKSFFQDLIETWEKEKVGQMAASLSLNAILSLPSLVILLMTFAGFFYSQSDVKSNIFAFLAQTMDEKTSQSFTSIIDAVVQSQQKTSATILSLLILFWTSSLLFENLLDSLHSLWKVKIENTNKIKKFLMNKVFAVLFIVFIDVIFFLSFFLQNIFNAAQRYFDLEILSLFSPLVNIGMTFFLPFLLFIFLFKFFSHGVFTWKEAAIGSLMTTCLFMIGNQLLSIYFSRFTDYSAFGVSNIIIISLVWIYYVSQILFLGAEATYLYTKKYRSKEG